MYTEEYEHKGFPLRNVILKVIFVVIFIALMIWLVPKMTNSSVKTNKNDEIKVETFNKKIFSNNLKKMKKAAIKYYSLDKLPQDIGESVTMTLGEMIDRNLIGNLKDKYGKNCDTKKSYIKITKLDQDYLLKVYLVGSKENDYILVHVGDYSYCTTDICEKDDTKINEEETTPSTTVEIAGESDDKIPNATDSAVSVPKEESGKIYEYAKTTNASFSNWSSWSAWTKTSCNTQAVNCVDSSPTCLKKIARYNKREKLEDYLNYYSKTRSIIKSGVNYNANVCSNYNYVVINEEIYATNASVTYGVVDSIQASTSADIGNWEYKGRDSYTTAPADTYNTHYEFVGGNFSSCGETCSNPQFYYDKYIFTGLTKVANTTTVPGGSCGSVVSKTVPVYYSANQLEKASRKEPLYGTVCYQSSKSRKINSTGSTVTKWSTYNDTSLLNNGYYYTGNSKASS